MTNYPRKAKIYMLLVIGIGVFLFLFSLFNGDFNKHSLTAIVIFGMLAVISESLSVNLPRGGALSVGFALEYAMLLLFGPTLTIFVSILGSLLGTFKRSKSDIFKFLFNLSQFIVTVYAAGYVYQICGGEFGKISLLQPVPLFVLALTYFVVNATAVTIGISLAYSVSPLGIWASNIKWCIPNFLALAPMGLLMAYLYMPDGSPGYTYPIRVIFFFAPLLIARYSFKLYMDMRDIHLDTVAALVDAIDAKDRYTRGHSERVAKLSVALSKKIGLSEEQVENMEYAALLHDIGKIGVREHILNKPGKLTDDEFMNIKEHPGLGAKIVARMENFEGLSKIIRSHHERIDGRGYPDGLAGEEIPLASRIIAVADTYDAMTSERPYRPPLDKGVALLEIGRVAGSQLDPNVVDVFLQLAVEESGEDGTMSLLEAAASCES